jgi:hypothetical protein
MVRDREREEALEVYLRQRVCSDLVEINRSVLVRVNLSYHGAAEQGKLSALSIIIECENPDAHTLSPLIMYKPNGTISTPSSAENSRSTQSASTRFDRRSNALSVP